MFAVLLFACTNPVNLSGHVKDIWGKPIVGAEIKLKGNETPETSGSDGSFSFSLADPPSESKEFTFRADADGFMYGTANFTYSPENQSSPLVIELYKELADAGFYVLGEEDYTPIKEESIQIHTTELEQIIGIKDIGSTTLTGDEVLFKTPLRKEQIQQLDLKIHRLHFQEKRLIKGVKGPEEVDLDLWLPKEEHPFTIKGLNSEQTYRLTIKDLPAGVYAFSSNGILDKRGKTLNLPKELQEVFPFEKK